MKFAQTAQGQLRKLLVPGVQLSHSLSPLVLVLEYMGYQLGSVELLRFGDLVILGSRSVTPEKVILVALCPMVSQVRASSSWGFYPLPATPRRLPGKTGHGFLSTLLNK